MKQIALIAAMLCLTIPAMSQEIPPPAETGTYGNMLTWNGPTTRTDGSSLDPATVSFILYWGADETSVSNQVLVASPTQRADGTFEYNLLTDAPDGTFEIGDNICVQLSAFTTTGQGTRLESDRAPTSPLCFALDAPPNPPSQVEIVD